jgi:beta-galactosidase
MGNSNGNFREYWDIISSSKHMQGGFIWDWVDQGLRAKDSKGMTFWAYGGDLGGFYLQHDENGVADGLLSSDRTPDPAAYEVKKVYQSIHFSSQDIINGKIIIKNLFDFTDLDQFDFYWKIVGNGIKIDESRVTIAVPPKGEKEVIIPVSGLKLADGVEYFLHISALMKTSVGLLPANHEVASEQFKISGDFFARVSPSGNSLVVKQDSVKMSFASGRISGEVDLKTGLIRNYRIQQSMRLDRLPEPHFWRAPTDNDFGNGMHEQLGIWRSAQQQRKLKSVTVGDQTAAGIPVRINYELTSIAVPYVIDYFIRDDGSIRITASMDMTGRELPELPRFGMRMRLSGRFDSLRYYGRGPWENYSDRHESAFIGLYSDNVRNQYFNGYIRPQESGYKTDVRWFSLTDSAGRGVHIQGIQPICFSALSHSTEDLDPGMSKKQQHPTDLPRSWNTQVNIDFKQRGVGGDDSWGALPHEKYRLLDKIYSYSYVIKLVDKTNP